MRVISYNNSDMMNKSFLITFFLLSISVTTLYGQKEKDSLKVKDKGNRFIDQWVFGGYLTLQFGTITVVAISPQAGYFINPQNLIGIGLGYEYYNEKWYNQRISSSLYTGRIFHEYTVFKTNNNPKRGMPNISFFTHLEYEAINLDRDFSRTDEFTTINRFWVHGVLIGGGFKQHFGRRSSLNIVLLYNIIDDSRLPYDNPQFRIGFYF